MENNDRRYILKYCMILILLIAMSLFVAIIVVESEIYSNASNEGWLGYIGGLSGSVISAAASFLVLYISNRNTERIQKENKQLQEDNLRLIGTPNVRVAGKQEFIANDVGKTLLKLRLFEENDIGNKLKSIRIININYSWSKEPFSERFETKQVYSNNNYVDLEYTPKEYNKFEKEEKKPFYYVNCELDNNYDEFIILKDFFELKFDAYIRTMFNVELEATFIVIFSPLNTMDANNCVDVFHQYIYYKNVKYNNPQE